VTVCPWALGSENGYVQIADSRPRLANLDGGPIHSEDQTPTSSEAGGSPLKRSGIK
jgi:hypothetical protein